MTGRPFRIFLAALLVPVSCRPAEAPPLAQQAATPPLVVKLSAEAARAAGIETRVVGEAGLAPVLELTGTLAAKPWIPEEQTALSDAENADARLRLAEASFARTSRLHAEGIVARQDLDTAQAARDQARATAAEADARRANLGLSVDARTLESQAGIWGLASLPETDLSRARAGENVEVTTPAFPGRRFSAKVIGVSRSADPETRNFTVRIAVDDPAGQLHPQMLATFAIALPAPAGLAVPRSAVLLEGDGSYVYVAEESLFRKQAVRTGASTPDAVEVVEGLSRGQRVVVKGAQILESERLKSRFRPAEAD